MPICNCIKWKLCEAIRTKTVSVSKWEYWTCNPFIIKHKEFLSECQLKSATCVLEKQYIIKRYIIIFSMYKK